MSKTVMLIYGVMACLGPNLYAQSFKDRLASMQQEYKFIDKLHVRISIRVFEHEGLATPYFSEEAEIKRSGRNYSYRVGSTDLLMNEQYLIVADRESREIVCSYRDLKIEQQYSDAIESSFDSLTVLLNTPTLVETVDGIEHYRMREQTLMVQQVDVFISVHDNVLQKIEYHYKDGQLVVIEFTTFNKNPQFGSTEFNEHRYVVEEHGVLRAAGMYKGYHMVNASKN